MLTEMILDNQKTELHNDLQNAAAMTKFTRLTVSRWTRPRSANREIGLLSYYSKTSRLCTISTLICTFIQLKINAVCSVYFRSKINSFLFFNDSQDNLTVCNTEVYMTQLSVDFEKYNWLASERHEICTSNPMKEVQWNAEVQTMARFDREIYNDNHRRMLPTGWIFSNCPSWLHEMEHSAAALDGLTDPNRRLDW